MPGNAQVDARAGLILNGGVVRKVGTVAVNLLDVAAASVVTTDITITGAEVGDLIMLFPPHTFGATGGTSGDDHLVLQSASVQAANTVRLSIQNTHATEAQDAPVLTWFFILIAA